MSVRVLSRVLGSFHEDSDPADRLVLIVLADAAHDDGVTWVSQKLIAEQSRLSERHVRRCLRELEGRGEIEARKAQRGRSRISVYRVTNAAREVEYDRLPFTVDAPFSTTGQGDRVKIEEEEPDDRTSTAATTGHLAHISEDALSVGPVSRTRNPPARVAPDAAIQAPKLTKINGRDVPFDYLAAECAVAAGSPRLREVAVALNGPRGQPEKGIREQRWRELLAQEAGSGWPPEWTPEIAQAYERALALEIQRRAAMYRQKLPGATLSPGALAKWWTDLPGLKRAGNAVGADRLVARAQEHARRGE